MTTDASATTTDAELERDARERACAFIVMCGAHTHTASCDRLTLLFLAHARDLAAANERASKEFDKTRGVLAKLHETVDELDKAETALTAARADRDRAVAEAEQANISNNTLRFTVSSLQAAVSCAKSLDAIAVSAEVAALKARCAEAERLLTHVVHIVGENNDVRNVTAARQWWTDRSRWLTPWARALATPAGGAAATTFAQLDAEVRRGDFAPLPGAPRRCPACHGLHRESCSACMGSGNAAPTLQSIAETSRPSQVRTSTSDEAQMPESVGDDSGPTASPKGCDMASHAVGPRQSSASPPAPRACPWCDGSQPHPAGKWCGNDPAPETPSEAPATAPEYLLNPEAFVPCAEHRAQVGEFCGLSQGAPWCCPERCVSGRAEAERRRTPAAPPSPEAGREWIFQGNGTCERCVTWTATYRPKTHVAFAGPFICRPCILRSEKSASLTPEVAPEPVKCIGGHAGYCTNDESRGAPVEERGGAGLLTFAGFSRANQERCEATSGYHTGVLEYGAATWALCLAEEAGEVMGAVLGATGQKKRKAHLTAKDVGDELADLVAYADLLAHALGLDLGACVAAKWNKVSERIGYAGRLAEAAATPDIRSRALHDALEAVQMRFVRTPGSSYDAGYADARRDCIRAIERVMAKAGAGGTT